MTQRKLAERLGHALVEGAGRSLGWSALWLVVAAAVTVGAAATAAQRRNEEGPLLVGFVGAALLAWFALLSAMGWLVWLGNRRRAYRASAPWAMRCNQLDGLYAEGAVTAATYTCLASDMRALSEGKHGPAGLRTAGAILVVLGAFTALVAPTALAGMGMATYCKQGQEFECGTVHATQAVLGAMSAGAVAMVVLGLPAWGHGVRGDRSFRKEVEQRWVGALTEARDSALAASGSPVRIRRKTKPAPAVVLAK